jgi:hypothetical protein
LDDLWDFANWNWNSQRTISIYLDLLKEQKKENIFAINPPVVVDFQLGKKVKSSSANPGLNNCGFTLWLFNIALENGPFIDGLPGFTY